MTINDIPKVALLDANEKELDEGYFFKYPEHMGPGIYNGAPPKIPDVLCYASYDQGDWNLPNMPRFRKVTPPHHFKVKPTEIMKANAYFLRQCAALFRQQELLPFFLLLNDYLRLKNVSPKATKKMKDEVSNFIMMFDGTLENCISKLFARIRTSKSKESYKKALDQYQSDIEEERRKQDLL